MARLTNGGIIGKASVDPTPTSANGKWNMSDQHIYKQISDIFSFSNLSAGSLTISTADNVLNSYYSVSSQVNASSTSVSVSSASGLAVNDKIMIYQTAHSTNFGLWEINRISGISGNNLTLKNPTYNTYYVGGGTSGSTQIVKIPEYDILTLNSGSSIITSSWNGSTGGVIVLNASRIILNSGSTVSASARGYRFYDINSGGQAFTNGRQGETYSYTPYGNTNITAFNGAGGGGGGGAPGQGNGGGGGGAAHRNNGTNGVSAGSNGDGGAGGASYGTTDLFTRITFGTGGSGGGEHDTGVGRYGGHGGGVVILMADTITFSGGTISSNGGTTVQTYGNYSGGSSGGSGGSIGIFAKNTNSSSTSVSIAAGGNSSGSGFTWGAAGTSSQGRYAIYTESTSAPSLSSSQTLDVASGSYVFQNTKLIA